MVRPTHITLGEILGKWLRDYVATNTAARTGERYSQIVHLHLIPNLGRTTLTNLKLAAVSDPLGFGAFLVGGALGGKAFGKTVSAVKTRVFPKKPSQVVYLQPRKPAKVQLPLKYP